MLEKKNTSTTECSKSIVICDVVICDVGTIKCEEKKRGGTIECDKNTATCDVGIAQIPM